MHVPPFHRNELLCQVGQEHITGSIESVLQAIKFRRPTLARVIERYKDYTVQQYVETFAQNDAEPIQPREDLVDVATAITRRILGRDAAAKLRQELTVEPVILTGNHHCPDYLPFTVQGSILFGLAKKPESVVPIFAGGGIPLNNANYPRGVVISRESKINIFREKYRRALVSITYPFTADMVDKGRRQVTKLKNEGRISEAKSSVVTSVLEEDYLSEEVLQQQSYSDQITVLNQRLWKKMFATELQNEIPEMIYLELEKSVVALLSRDLRANGSFAHEILFNASLRNAILTHLDGIAGCWDTQQLALLTDSNVKGEERGAAKSGAGTAFFWGLGKKGRRYSMGLKETEEGPYLIGVGDSGETHELAFTPRNVIKGMKAGALFPNMFLSFASVSFARGFKCYGGFMQTDYLTEMKRGLYAALRQEGFDDWARKVESVPTANYVTGMISIALSNGVCKAQPAGTVDIIEKGGLMSEDLEKIRAQKVLDANLLGLSDIDRFINGEENHLL